MLIPAIVVIAAVVIIALVLVLRRKPKLPGLDELEELPPPKPAAKAAGRPEPKEAAEPPKPKLKQTMVGMGPEGRPAAPSPDLVETKPERERKVEPERQAEESAEEEQAPEEPEEEAAVSVEVSPPAPPPPRRKRDVPGLRKGLAKMRQENGFFGRLKLLLAGKKEIDPGLCDEIEQVLITSDVGAKTTAMLLSEIREGLAKNELGDEERVWAALRKRAKQLLDVPGGGGLRDHGKPTIVLVVGVNGTGKTTTIGKLATKLSEQGKKVLLVGGDTFRAAAVQQLQAWGKRTGCDVFAGKEGADPASVVFEAIAQAQKDRLDVVLCDTAGRLHTKSNLMDELKKVHRTAQKAMNGAPHEVLLVVDGTNGQNAVAQAEQFSAALPLSGIVLTKLDGTAKGGVVLAIAAERKLPVRYVGVGERPTDLRDFDAEEFVEALLGQNDDAARAA